MKVNRRKSREAGQSILLMALALGLFLFGVVAFAVDLGNMWWHRQRAQGAADAACIAGAMDLLVYNQTPSPTQAQLDALGGNPKAGSSFTCSPSSKASACEYAALNDYNSAGVTAGSPGNLVTVSFPSSLPNATAPTVTVAAANPVWFMKVNVWDSVQTYFVGMLSGRRAQDVGAFATCGAVQVSSPVPILVLKPSGSGTLNMNGGGGSGGITIAGGPSQSIEVNSSDPNAACVFCGGGSTNASVDLTKAGPNNDGADFGVWGGPGTAPTFVKCGTGDQNCWKPNDPPITDPFAAVAAPPKGSTITTVPTVGNGTDGCTPLSGNTTCDEYSPGYYANGIQVKNRSAIFNPGVYYIDNASASNNPTGLSVDAQSCARPSTLAGDGSYGTVFYFANGATLNIQSGSQTKCVTSFSVTTGGLSGHGVFCPTLPAQIPASLQSAAALTGNVFLGPCKSVGTNVYGGDKLFNDSTQRGMLFFQDHTANKSTDQPKLQGGGTYAAAGGIYFHATDYSDLFTLTGGSGSGSFAYGNIIVDQLQVGGGSGINMYLNPGLLTTGILKATLIQ